LLRRRQLGPPSNKTCTQGRGASTLSHVTCTPVRPRVFHDTYVTTDIETISRSGTVRDRVKCTTTIDSWPAHSQLVIRRLRKYIYIYIYIYIYTVEPGYNDIVLCDTSSITWYQLNSSLLTIILHSSVTKSPGYNDIALCDTSSITWYQLTL